MMISLPNQITLSPDVLFQELGDESVLLNLQTQHYYGLDEVGTRLWQLLTDNGGDMVAATAQLLVEYEVDEATLQQDLTNLIGGLVDAQLITVQT
jgi:hypothetical protein